MQSQPCITAGLASTFTHTGDSLPLSLRIPLSSVWPGYVGVAHEHHDQP